jgi:hypothetical protein
VGGIGGEKMRAVDVGGAMCGGEHTCRMAPKNKLKCEKGKTGRGRGHGGKCYGGGTGQGSGKGGDGYEPCLLTCRIALSTTCAGGQKGGSGAGLGKVGEKC